MNIAQSIEKVYRNEVPSVRVTQIKNITPKYILSQIHTHTHFIPFAPKGPKFVKQAVVEKLLALIICNA